MAEHRDIVDILKKELQFLEMGGYRSSPGSWKPPLIFEDSPTCLKQGEISCTGVGCPLLPFVPLEHRTEAVPCRHIPLNEHRETIDTLYRMGTEEELETALRGWLVKTIARLEQKKVG